jgi:hypothetical protein
MALLSRIFRLIDFSFVCLNLNKPKYFQKRKKKRQKRKRKSIELPVVAKMQGCSGFFIKNFIETQAKMNRKKNRNTRTGLADLSVQALWGDRLNLSFFFALGVISISLQNNCCNLTKVCRQKACVVTALEWSDWMG